MPKLIRRSQWGAKGGDGASLAGPLAEVIIHTEDGPDRPDAWTTAQFAAAVRAIEAFHVGPSRGWDGIAYSWLIADNGDVFEGRGWLQSGAHTEGHNRTAHAICFLGNGDAADATPAQWASARWLIGQGIAAGAVRPDPKISGHRDYSAKSCPGSRIYPHLARLRGITGPIDIDSEEDPLMGITVQDIENAAIRAQEKFWGGRPVGFGQTTGAGTLAAVLKTVQTLVNDVRGAESRLAAKVAASDEALQAAVLGALAAMPTANLDPEDVELLAAQLQARLVEAGVSGVTADEVLDALQARLVA